VLSARAINTWVNKVEETGSTVMKKAGSVKLFAPHRTLTLWEHHSDKVLVGRLCVEWNDMLCFCYVTSRHVTSRHVMSCHVMLLCYVILCYATLCYGMLCYVMLCYVMLCYVMLCYGMVWYGMLCYAMLCYVMLCVMFQDHWFTYFCKCRSIYL
jgi:hypothetical protein